MEIMRAPTMAKLYVSSNVPRVIPDAFYTRIVCIINVY